MTTKPDLPAGLTIKGAMPTISKAALIAGRWYIEDAAKWQRYLSHAGEWVQFRAFRHRSDDFSWPTPESAAEFAILHADLPEGWEIVKWETQWMVRKSPHAAGPLYSTAREAYTAALAAARTEREEAALREELLLLQSKSPESARTGERCKEHNRPLVRLPDHGAWACPDCLVEERDETLAELEDTESKLTQERERAERAEAELAVVRDWISTHIVGNRGAVTLALEVNAEQFLYDNEFGTKFLERLTAAEAEVARLRAAILLLSPEIHPGILDLTPIELRYVAGGFLGSFTAGDIRKYRQLALTATPSESEANNG